MNISKVESSNSMVLNSTSHSIVEKLQKQKMELSKQIETVKAGTGDIKAKAERIKGINDQIAEVDKQIQQAQFEEHQKQLEKSQQKNAEKREQEKYENAGATEKAGVVLSASLNDLLAASNGHSKLKDMNRTRMKLHGEVNVAQSEINQSMQNGGSVKYQIGVVSEKEEQISQIADKMHVEIGEVQNHIDKAEKTGINEAETELSNKQDQVEDKELEQDGKKVDNMDGHQTKAVAMPVDIGIATAIQENELDKTIEKSAKSIDVLA